MSVFSERLQSLMEKYKLKKVDLVRKCEPFCKDSGVSITTPDVSLFTSGKRLPKFNKIQILAKALNTTPSYLMGYDEIPPNNVVNIQNQTHNSNITTTMETEIHENKEEAEILRIFRNLPVRFRHKALSYFYELEDQSIAQQPTLF